jgi:hypothetical protein
MNYAFEFAWHIILINDILLLFVSLLIHIKLIADGHHILGINKSLVSLTS